jgi:hypothetical protein
LLPDRIRPEIRDAHAIDLLIPNSTLKEKLEKKLNGDFWRRYVAEPVDKVPC